MTKKDFFILIIKLFGLSSIITSVFAIVPAHLSYGMLGLDSLSFMVMVLTVIIIFGLFAMLIFRSEEIVTWLKLDQGFEDDRIEIGNLKTAEIIQFGVIVIGGLLILNNISEFLTHTYYGFRGEIQGQIYGEMEKLNWTISGANLVVGYLLLTNHSRVASVLDKSNQEKEGNMEP